MKKLNNNDYIALNNILLNDDMSRTELSHILEISPPAVFKIIKKLQEKNLILETNEIMQVKGGRPRKLLLINKEYKLLIGVYLEIDSVITTISYLTGEILETRKRKKTQILSKVKILKVMMEELDYVINKYKRENIVGIGFSVPGIINPHYGIIKSSSISLGRNINLKEYIEKMFQLPCIVENNVKSILYAEKLQGCLQNEADAIYLYYNTELSLSLLLNHKVHHGINFMSAQIGDITYENNIVLKDYYNELKLYEKANLETFDDINLEKFFDYAQQNIEPYYSVIKELGEKIALHLTNLIKVIDVETIVFSGIRLQDSSLLTETIKQNILNNIDTELYTNIKFMYSTLFPTFEEKGSTSLVLGNLFADKKLIK